MPNALYIKKDDPKIPADLLFKELRKKGMDHIATFSGELWTDHNLHDPGITILEVLCYAISDLAYRTNLDIEDLLAAEFGSKENNFFTPEQILSCNPLTIVDYRKMLVDIAGVRNAWLVPANEQEVPLFINCEKDELEFSPVSNANPAIGPLVLNGLYKVYLDIDPILALTQKETSVIDTVLTEVTNRLNQHRNLCEDFLEIIVLKDEQIGLCGDIELAPDANPDEVLEAIYEVVENFLSPRLNFYSLKEMLDKGKSIEEIFEGRPYTPAYGDRNGKYSHGFIDTDELINAQLPDTLKASDLYRVIMDIEGVRAIKSLLLNNFKDDIPATVNGEEWVLHLTQNHRPLFAPDLSTFNFTKGVIRLSANREKVINRFRKRLQDFRKTKFDPTELDLRIPYGNYRPDIDEYSSIQNEFPIVYGVGKGHLSENVPLARKMEALQLKAYLTFFDQMLAGYLSQLSNIRQQFSWDVSDESPSQTYFQQTIKDIPLANKVFLSSDQNIQNPDWEEGEVIALPPTPFAHPTERDMAIIQMVNLFSNHSNEADNNIITIEKEDDQAFRFLVIGANGSIVLQSKLTYETAEEATLAADVLFFQGTLSQTYEAVNYPELSEYSFSFVYKTVNYNEYLKRITESETAYYERKDELLNHLLARFGEQFTEYVLLMYALNQGAPDPKDIIKDKARFLEKYPDISRNRGRGFDYTQKDNIWNSKENISGFEKRVAGLMGLEDWERRNLNNFEVVLREEQYLLTIKDHRGTILFESTLCYDLEDIDDELINEFALLLCDPNAYQKVDCILDSIYGFRLCTKAGKIFANYHRSFGSQALRDEILACTQNYFSGSPIGIDVVGDKTSPFLGQVVKIVAEKEGYYFMILNEDETEVYLKSSEAYLSEEEACFAMVELIELAKQKTNYINTKGNYDGGPFSFVIYKDTEAKEEFAFYPKGYSSKASRTKKKNAIASELSGKKLNYKIDQQATLYSWSLLDEKSNAILQSIHRFKSEEHASDAWGQFKIYGTERTNFRKKDSDEGYSFLVYKEEVALATSPFFETDEERNLARIEAMELLQAINESETDISFSIDINTHIGGYNFVVFDKDNEAGLIGTECFDSKNKAACAYYHFLEKACDPAYYSEVAQAGTCYFSFEVKDGDKTLAYHPQFYLKEEKESIQKKLIDFIQKNKINFNIASLPGAHHFEIHWENCEGVWKPLLIENGEHLTALAAQNAAADFLTNYTINQWQEVREGANYSFVIKNEHNIISAEHPEFYSSIRKRDKVLESVMAMMKRYKSLMDNPDTFFEELIEKTPKWKLCSDDCQDNKTDEFCLLSGFRLRKTDASLAYHPTVFNDVDTQCNYMQQLLIKAQCDQLYYSDICLQGTKLVREIQGKFYFEIWGNNPSLLFWRSTDFYNSDADTIQAFEDNWLGIVELARRKSNYKLPEEDYPYISLWNDNIRVACFPEKMEANSSAYEKIEELYKMAMSYPIYQAVDGFRFRIMTEDCKDVLWESIAAYPNIEEALQAFIFFTSLLKQETNYRQNNNKDACIFKIEISETLLESNRTYTDTFVRNNAVFLGTTFDSETLALASLSDLQQGLINLDSFDIDPKQNTVFVEGEGFYYVYNLDNINGNWRSEIAYNSQAAAMAALNEFFENSQALENYQIYENEEDGKFYIVLRNLYLKNQIENTEDIKTDNYAVCPAVYPKDKIRIGTDELFVSENTIEFEDADCLEKICPAAWDQGLQSFLIDAINEDNYYPFIDYQGNCQLGFRVVTEKYKLARNVREFHLPEHQSQFKDWLYGYSRCNKELGSDLPIAKIFKKNGLYHYCIEGDFPKLRWCRESELSDSPEGRGELIDLYQAEYLHFFCLAQKKENYQIETLDIDGKNFFRISITLEDGIIFYADNNGGLYESQKDFQAAIQCSILYASTMFAYLSEPDNQPVFLVDTNEDNHLMYCFSIPELLWSSYKGYDTKDLAVSAFNDEIFDFYAYAQEIDFYELGREETPGAGRQLELTKEDGSLIALSFQKYLNETLWNNGVLYRIQLARKFPYFYYNGKFGFQCFSLEDAPVFEMRERTDCDFPAPVIVDNDHCVVDTSGTISVTIPGEVIWESIHEYSSFDELQCAYDAFISLLNDKENYQQIQLQDCNLFGLEITHPNEVLATHPQRYFTKTELELAIERTKNCINAEGFHLVEHILLRPKQGVSDHITIQFLAKQEMDCKDEDGTTLYTELPYLLEKRSFSNAEIASKVKNRWINILLAFIRQNIDSDGIINKNAIIEKLRNLKKQVVVNANISSLLDTIILIAKDKIQFSGDDGIPIVPDDLLDDFIFCFNKSNKATNDKLIPNCPDCENAEALPSDNAAEVCEDAKSALKNTGVEEEIISQEYYVAGADPYSFWTTIVLPYWPNRFQNANFRNFFQDTLRREAPAHIGLRICWLDPKQMKTFENAYRNWLEAFSGNEDCNLQEAQDRLICILFDEEDGISNVYPPAQLQEGGCAPGGTSDPGAVLLDFTQLG